MNSQPDPATHLQPPAHCPLCGLTGVDISQLSGAPTFSCDSCGRAWHAGGSHLHSFPAAEPGSMGTRG